MSNPSGAEGLESWQRDFEEMMRDDPGGAADVLLAAWPDVERDTRLVDQLLPSDPTLADDLRAIREKYLAQMPVALAPEPPAA